ncbi:FxsB family cyclophane-forming radical SAM/SPASM peptide maturase [Actinomadura rugatobispora]|uniref:FxsB family cyclophane-forming radical SAM/SPASM peptide maturase n=1 Tax=Actinomadura rugatobispora TaxID=1994 RepID=A0ABW1A4T0_9ACTN|nr:FxsB family radical SAM/SPASM domain protein [Actinomadura rugatobispora]
MGVPGHTDGVEWPGALNVSELVAEGWTPTPFRQFILKIHSRCNLSCDYCYMYHMADQSWREQPRTMAPELIDKVAERIGEHVRAHRLPRIEFILHGGEPLLAGPARIRRAVTAVRAAAAPAEVRAYVQTNGVLLDEAFLDLFAELSIRVGVSLDGGEASHDRHRRFANGRGSHAAVSAGIRRLASPEYRHLFSGLLATVDLRAGAPVATYEALARHAPPVVDFLLPHGNWSAPPPGRHRDDPATPYGDWLVAVFDHWFGETDDKPRIRLFSEIIRLLLGGRSRTEAVGLSPAAMAVIETGGQIEQVDTLKSAYHGAARTGLNIVDDPFDRALLSPWTAARQMGADALASSCRSCPVGRICGGGMYPHRYRAGSGFANPSVYCPDLMRLIRHVRRTVARDLVATGHLDAVVP